MDPSAFFFHVFLFFSVLRTLGKLKFRVFGALLYLIVRLVCVCVRVLILVWTSN